MKGHYNSYKMFIRVFFLNTEVVLPSNSWNTSSIKSATQKGSANKCKGCSLNCWLLVAKQELVQNCHQKRWAFSIRVANLAAHATCMQPAPIRSAGLWGEICERLRRQVPSARAEKSSTAMPEHRERERRIGKVRGGLSTCPPSAHTLSLSVDCINPHAVLIRPSPITKQRASIESAQKILKSVGRASDISPREALVRIRSTP